MLKGYKLLILLTFLAVSCADQSEIDPLFQPKSFCEATGCKPIKLIIPITDKSMDRIDPAAITYIQQAKSSEEIASYKETSWPKRFWEGVKGAAYSAGAKLGFGKISISLEHSLADIEIDSKMVKENIRSIKISKAFFSFSRPCELNSNDQTCRDFSGVFNKKTPSFSILNKAIMNLSLKPESAKVSDKVNYELLANDQLKEQNILLKKPQVDFNSPVFMASEFLPQNYNIGYYNGKNKGLEDYYLLKDHRDNKRNVLLVHTKDGLDLFEDFIQIISQKEKLSQDQVKKLLRFEFDLSENRLLIDFNRHKEWKSDFENLIKLSKLEVEKCTDYICVDVKSLMRGAYYFKSSKLNRDDIFIINRAVKRKEFLATFYKRLADKTQISEELLKRTLEHEILFTKDSVLIDLSRFQEIAKDIKDIYSLQYHLFSCDQDRCIDPKINLTSRDNISHLRMPGYDLSQIAIIDVDEKKEVQIKNDILKKASEELGKSISQLRGEMITDIVSMHNQIYFNFNDFGSAYKEAFEKAFAYTNTKFRTCSDQQCLFVPTNKLNLKPLLSKSTAGKIDILLDVNKVPEVALYLKGYLELEIVLDL